MTNGRQCKCPLCDGSAQTATLIGLATSRIECEKCTTYEISEGLEKILADNPEAKRRARYLSDAARRATHGADPRDILELCLKLTEDNYLAVAAYEDALQA